MKRIIAAAVEGVSACSAIAFMFGAFLADNHNDMMNRMMWMLICLGIFVVTSDLEN